MAERTILCYGDSNTYGYDPRGFWGGRYEANSRWCDLMARKTGWRIINCGENGRMIPTKVWEYQLLMRCIEENASVDTITVMLGTNDVLMGLSLTVEEIVARMEKLLQLLQKECPKKRLVLIAPPQIALPEEELCGKLEAVQRGYEALAAKLGVDFCSAARWELPMASDGVHLSPEAHQIFAEKLIAYFMGPNGKIIR